MAMINGEDGSGVLGMKALISINAGNTDIEIKIGPGKYILRRFIVTDASTSLAISIATLGLYTAAAAGGVTLVTPAVLTTLTAATKFVDMSLALTTDYLTASSLFIRNVTAHGSAATVSAYIIGEVLY